MINVLEYLSNLKLIVPILRTVIIVSLLIIVFNIILSFIKRRLEKRAKTRKQFSNIEIFSKIIKYLFTAIIIIIGIFSFAGSWSGLGLTVGLMSAALGWALQKPITGIAAWIMVVTKRPFEIGDRVIIGTVKGDIDDITLTHVYLKEVGGLVAGEEISGRMVLIPNSTLFEQNITNYTSKNEYVLDQVVTSVTYESNLNKAVKISLDAAKKYLKEFTDLKEKPYVRTFFQPSAIGVHIRYFAPTSKLQEISSNITKEIFDEIRKTKDVEIAYPHTEIIFKDKKFHPK